MYLCFFFIWQFNFLVSLGYYYIMKFSQLYNDLTLLKKQS